jgi:hypothetical protein
MDKVLRDIVLGLGILFGFVRTEDPLLSMRVYRDARAISVNMEIAHAFSKDALSLLESGNDLTLSFTVEANGYGSHRFSHGIGFDPIALRYRITLEETGAEHESKERDAALDIAARVYGFHLLDVSEYDPGRALEVRASCALEVKGMDAGVVWNYKNPEVARTFGALSEIPR